MMEQICGVDCIRPAALSSTSKIYINVFVRDNILGEGPTLQRCLHAWTNLQTCLRV